MKNKFFIALVSSGVIFLFSLLPAFHSIERQFLDLSFQIRGSEKPHEDIVIIEISDQSLELMGQWPWPRSYHAALLKLLSNYKPRAIFYDMLFSENSLSEMDDIALAKSIETAGNVVLPFFFSANTKGEFYNEPSGLPIPKIREHVKLGYANVFPEPDGHVRAFPLAHIIDNQLYLHASLAIANFVKNYPETELRRFADQKSTLINFPGPLHAFNVWPFEMITTWATTPDKQASLRMFKDKIILVGHTATATAMDLKPTAFSPQLPGVAIQASMLHTLLTKKFIREIQGGLHLLLLFLYALVIIYLATHHHTVRASLYTFSSLVFIFVSCQILFQHALFWVPFFSFFVLGAVLFIILTIAQLIRVRFEKELFSRELSLASKIQMSFLPTQIPQIPGMQLDLYNLPAKHVGGDLYDAVALENERLGICIGDVSGKGIPAALFMAKSISEFRREANVDKPSMAVSNLNDRLANAGTGGLFLTLLYVILDYKKKTYLFSSGGHEPIMHYKNQIKEVVQQSSDSGLPLGIAPGGTFDFKEAKWDSGDILFMMTDGIKEAMSPRREIYGFDRLKKAIRESALKSPKEIIQHVLEDIRRHVSTAPQHDDMTAVCVKFV